MVAKVGNLNLNHMYSDVLAVFTERFGHLAPQKSGRFCDAMRTDLVRTNKGNRFFFWVIAFVKQFDGIVVFVVGRWCSEYIFDIVANTLETGGSCSINKWYCGFFVLRSLCLGIVRAFAVDGVSLNSYCYLAFNKLDIIWLVISGNLRQIRADTLGDWLIRA